MKQLIRILAMMALISLTACSWFKKVIPAEPVEVLTNDTLRVNKDALDNLKMEKADIIQFPELLSLMGKISVTEDRTTIVPARVAGRIENIYFASGEHVNAGQVLTTLFSPDFVSAKEEYLQSVKQQKSKSDESAAKAVEKSTGSFSADPSDFANLAQLARKKLLTMGLSSSDIEDMVKHGAVEDEKASLLGVRAPRSGVLIQKSAALGNLVNVGDTLFIIGDLDKVWFAGDIYPEDLPKIHKDQEVFINAVGVNKPLYGKVSFISPLVDPNTRSIKIRALMNNPNHALKADEYVQGNVILEDKTALVVPTVSIVQTPTGPVVFKKINSATSEMTVSSIDFKKIAVKIGSEQGGHTAIIGGELNKEDVVVSDGSWLLDASLNSAQSSSASGEGK